jgi:AcrR family transcriptional regulator
MAGVPDNERAATKRRVPQQVRSRDRVARILEVTSQLVVQGGVEPLTTRAIATAAAIPVASLYQYFADKEAILLALVERDVAEMDDQVARDLRQLRLLSMRTIVETTMRAFVKVYHRRPAFVMIYLRGRTNPEIRDFCRQHNRRVARELFEFARAADMVPSHSTGRYAELAVEVGDRLFQLAFEHSLDGDGDVIDEGIAMVSSYLETHATPHGIAGITV